MKIKLTWPKRRKAAVVAANTYRRPTREELATWASTPGYDWSAER